MRGRRVRVTSPHDAEEHEADRLADEALDRCAGRRRVRARSPAPPAAAAAGPATAPATAPVAGHAAGPAPGPEPVVRRQDDDGGVPSPDATPPLSGPRVSLLPHHLPTFGHTEIDWFEMRRPFVARGAEFLLYGDDRMATSIADVWLRNLAFLQLLGLGEDLSVSATNFLTPFAIDAALAGDHPTAPERIEREAGFSSFGVNPTLLHFDVHALPRTLRAPWLEFFGVDQPNPYAGPVRRRAADPGGDRGAGGHGPVAMVGPAPTGSGSPLQEGVRRPFERDFGHDFRQVRVHTDEAAHVRALRHGAIAYAYGHDLVFRRGAFAPGSEAGRRLLAHELAHVVQHDRAAGGPLTLRRQEAPAPTDAERVQEIRERVRAGGTLTEQDIAFLKEHIGREVVRQVLGGGTLRIDLDPSRPPSDVRRSFTGRLALSTSGAVGALAGGLDGTATAAVDVDATAATNTVTITISPPVEDDRLAAMIRELLFPGGRPRTFTTEVSPFAIQVLAATQLMTPVTITIAGPDARLTGGIQVRHESVPDGVVLDVTLVPSTRTTSVADLDLDLPSDHWTLTPDPRVWGTLGYGGGSLGHAGEAVVGLDVPLAFDTSLPLAYAGLGVRAAGAAGPGGASGRLGGTALVGLDLDPLSMHLGFGIGAAFLRDPVATDDGPAQVLFYTELEGVLAYRVMSNLEVLVRAGLWGTSDGSLSAGSGGAGLGYRF